jgi:plasmid stabilization system protein ParE
VTYKFHPEALAEYDEAAAYYKRRKPGLEKRFLAAVNDAIQRICETPER